MTDLPLSEVVAYNNKPLQELTWAIESSEGEFSLMLARCNYSRLRQQMVQRIKELCTLEIRELTLKESAKTLYTKIREELSEEQPAALMVLALELVSDLDHLLVATNQVREAFRQNFSFPLVLWVNDEVLKKLLQLAPDFESWATTTEFSLPTETLLSKLREDADTLFRKLLELDVGQFFDPNAIFEAGYRLEIDAALQDLELREEKLDPTLQASLELALGRQAYLKDETETALDYYQKSWDFWRQTGQLERQGILLFHSALCYVRQAERYGAKRCFCWEEARHYFQQSVEAFEEVQRTDVVAKLIPLLAEALQNLEDWEQLEAITRKYLALHQKYSNKLWIAQDYGFFAEAALKQSRWEDAHENAQKALEIIAQVPEEQLPHQSFFLLLLAEAQQQLDQEVEAIANLEVARELGSDHHPHLYIRILELLRSLYFQKQQYLNAFQVKLERRSIEQQYGLIAFMGAGRLKSQRQIRTVFAPTEDRSRVAQEIAASGRQGDVNRLMQRLAKPQHKLTVLYGQSGVGKSSMIEAALVPALKQQPLNTRDALPILLGVYNDWIQELGKQLTEALKAAGISNEFVVEGDSPAKILEQLQRNGEMNLMTVLIFDQFEEFFFTCCNDPNESKRFSEFFRNCLNTPFVKVILSLREDYLHLLLHCSRHVDLDAINNNILDKEVLYYIGNFSLKETKSIIESLTERSNFYLEPALVDELIKDLASELEEVRPIELQVVGAQLQAENITTLEQYHKLGKEPKETLVQRYLKEVVADCGPENQQAAELVLYLLTAENNTRPLKTRAELEKELKELVVDLAAEASKLDLVLDIFVKSGLVFLLPEIPANRYQLVHDYLVTFIRRQQEPKLKEELEQERRKRHSVEEELVEAEQRLDETNRKATLNEQQLVQAEQKLAKTNQQVQLTEERLSEAKHKLSENKRKARRTIRLGMLALLAIITTGATVVFFTDRIATEARLARRNAEIQLLEMFAMSLQLEEENLAYLNSVIQEDQENVYAPSFRAWLHKDNQRLDQAEEDIKIALERSPDHPFPLLLKVMIHAEKPENEEALETMNKIYALYPKNYSVLSIRAQLFVHIERYEDALKSYSEMIELYPKRSYPIMRRGMIRTQIGRYQTALDDFNRAIKLDPENSYALVGRATVKYFMSHYEEALADANQAIELNNQLSDAFVISGLIYNQQSQHEKAIAEFDKSLKITPENNDFTAYNWALAHQALGNIQESQFGLEYAIETAQNKYQLYQNNPQKLEQWRNSGNLALYYLAAGKLEQAEKLYREVLDKGMPQYLLQEAIRDLKYFLRLFPERADAQPMLELLESHLESQ